MISCLDTLEIPPFLKSVMNEDECEILDDVMPCYSFYLEVTSQAPLSLIFLKLKMPKIIDQHCLIILLTGLGGSYD